MSQLTFKISCFSPHPTFTLEGWVFSYLNQHKKTAHIYGLFFGIHHTITHETDIRQYGYLL
ncbi:hypothetical protein [Moraxella lacunata]|uniref:hypothetical protein n=1 Tax=Moraxella lacunata TaxID=477 RepID=UPI003EE3C8A8